MFDPAEIAARMAPEADALAAYWRFVEEHQAALQRHVYEMAKDIPEYAHILSGAAGSGGENEKLNRTLRRAYFDGDWGELLAMARRQATEYARSGVSFAHWFGFRDLFRTAYTELCRSEAPETATQLMLGFDLAQSVTLPALGDAFVEGKETILREAHARLEIYMEMFDAAAFASFVFRSGGSGLPAGLYIRKANRQALTLCGAEVIAAHRKHAMSAESGLPFMRAGLVDALQRVLETGEPHLWSTQAGSAYFDCRAFRLHREGHLGVVFADSTERHQHLATINKQMAEVERSNRDLDDFAYVASHDLKSPLSDVRNLSSWLAEDVGEQLPERSRRHLDLLGARVTRMEGLLDDLLEYSRVGRNESPTERFRFADVFEKMKSQLTIPKGFDVLLSAPEILFDGPRPPLETVLRNLVANAIKHHDHDAGTITISAEPGDERVTILVTDDGPGIDPSHFERIFRIFQTLRPRDEVEGSGVGLAIVKKSVEQQGGKVQIHSSGRGTTFEFTWPLVRPVS